MPYDKTVWKDQIVERPKTYHESTNADGSKTLSPAFGEIIQAGTPISADNMNKMEKGIEDAHNAIDNTNTALESTNEALTETNQNLEDHTHGHISKDGKIGSAADMFLVTGAGGTIDVLNAQAAVYALGISNPNILHNWDWNNPVNQRGVSGVLTNPIYFYDRWRGSGNTYTQRVEILPSCWVRIGPAQTPISQTIEFPDRFSGLTLTYSVEVEAVTGTEVTIRISDTNGFTSFAIPPGTTGIVSVTRSIASANATLSVLVVAMEGSAATIKRHKLELGSHSTLHLDPPMDYGTERLKCQRYFYRAPSYAVGYGYSPSSSTGYLLIPTPITLRTVPTLTPTPDPRIYVGGQTYATTTTSVSIRPEGVLLSLTTTGMPSGTSFLGHTDTAETVHMSADL